MPFSARSLAVPLAACVIFTSRPGSTPSLRIVDDALNLSVIKENAFAGLCIAEDFRE
jgi:hypothetical protein